MWIVDPSTLRLIEANTAASALYGYTPDELRALDLSQLMPKDDLRRFASTLSSQNSASPQTWRHRARSGQKIDVEVEFRSISYGGIGARLVVLSDITHRARLEDQLRQAQKMETVGMLAGGVAHDFNNLLTIITGYSQIVLHKMAADDPNRHALEQIMKAGESAAALTRQLLAFSRRQVPELKVVDVNPLVSGLGSMLSRLIGEHIDLRVVLGQDLGRVNADPGQIEQVVMNLVVNARDAMPEGGVLTIETANVELDRPFLSRGIALKPGPYVVLAVSDTGTGMDGETRSHLFEPFFTTKRAAKGTGLGLSTISGILRQCGGGVQVESELGSGTTVRVYWPRIGNTAVLEQLAAAPAPSFGSGTILLVEDDEMVRSLCRETLAAQGYEVLEADGAAEAARIAARFAGDIRLLVTDVVLPRGNGRELAERLAQSRPEMPVLYISGYTEEAIVNSGLQHGAVAFLQKPFTPAALAAKVREVLETGKVRGAGE